MKTSGMILTENILNVKAKGQSYPNIKQVNLCGMHLSDVSILRNLSRLEVVVLSVNDVTSLADFEHTSHLRELHIRRNQIHDLKQIKYLKDLRNLKILSLAENPCVAAAGDSYRLSVIHELPNLKTLDTREITDAEREAALQQQYSLFSSRKFIEPPISITLDEVVREPLPEAKSSPSPRKSYVDSDSDPNANNLLLTPTQSKTMTHRSQRFQDNDLNGEDSKQIDNEIRSSGSRQKQDSRSKVSSPSNICKFNDFEEKSRKMQMTKKLLKEDTQSSSGGTSSSNESGNCLEPEFGGRRKSNRQRHHDRLPYHNSKRHSYRSQSEYERVAIYPVEQESFSASSSQESYNEDDDEDEYQLYSQPRSWSQTFAKSSNTKTRKSKNFHTYSLGAELDDCGRYEDNDNEPGPSSSNFKGNRLRGPRLTSSRCSNQGTQSMTFNLVAIQNGQQVQDFPLDKKPSCSFAAALCLVQSLTRKDLITLNSFIVQRLNEPYLPRSHKKSSTKANRSI